MIKTITHNNYFFEVEKSQKPVLLDFWADWCGHCKSFAPVLEDVSEKAVNVKFCKINVDDEPELAEKFEIKSIPTLILLENGRVVDKKSGTVPKHEVLDML